MERFSEVAVRLRFVMLAATLVDTVGTAYLASTLKIYDDPHRRPPKDDPAVVLNEHLQRLFGDANLVTIFIARNDGQTIVQADTLARLPQLSVETNVSLWFMVREGKRSALQNVGRMDLE